MAAQKQYTNPLTVGDTVTVDLYGQKPGKVVATHDPGYGYGLSVEVELDKMWRGGKKFWFEAKDVKPRGFQVGDTVRVIGDVCKGLIGELKVIDPNNDAEGDFFGVQLDLIEGYIFFSAEELEKVTPEEEYKPHPDACLCDECAAIRFAMCGYDD